MHAKFMIFKNLAYRNTSLSQYKKYCNLIWKNWAKKRIEILKRADNCLKGTIRAD